LRRNVHEDVIWFDVAAGGQYGTQWSRWCDLPMDETHVVDSFDGEDTFCNVEARHVLRKRVVLDEHGHQVSPRKEFHDKVQVHRILEGIEELDNPW